LNTQMCLFSKILAGCSPSPDVSRDDWPTEKNTILLTKQAKFGSACVKSRDFLPRRGSQCGEKSVELFRAKRPAEPRERVFRQFQRRRGQWRRSWEERSSRRLEDLERDRFGSMERV
jgi:hypothetical protein